jgi:menaquinone-dependent protoporphyrinogen oxidase
MTKILIAYATNSGSTAEAAQVIAEEMRKTGAQVDVLPIAKVSDLSSYEALVLGAPMIMGWHRQALSFIRKHRSALQRLPLAVFITCMSLTKPAETNFQGVPVFVDEDLPQPPLNPEHLAFKERYSQVSNYLRPILRTCPVKPVSVGVFGGRLNFGQMQWWAMIFVILILQAKAGDKRNWPAMRTWASGLPALFGSFGHER